jgi:hypothetical protein
MTTFGYCWERRADAWWSDVFAEAHGPACAGVLTGDTADERLVFLGGNDGIVRVVDEDGTDDDGRIIAASVTLGPMRPRSGDRRARWGAWRVMLSQSYGGAVGVVYAGDEPDDDPGEPALTMTLVAGRTGQNRGKVRGNTIWLVLASGTLGQTWAFEEATAEVADAGRTR